jgi:type II secretory pathway component PulF
MKQIRKFKSLSCAASGGEAKISNLYPKIIKAGEHLGDLDLDLDLYGDDNKMEFENMIHEFGLN